MLQYAVCEVNKKQYKVIPNKDLLIDFLDGEKEIEAGVLLLVEDGKIQIGNPYLKGKLKFKVMEQIKADKIRVAKFHAKANYRKVIGQRAKLTKVVLIDFSFHKS